MNQRKGALCNPIWSDGLRLDSITTSSGAKAPQMTFVFLGNYIYIWKDMGTKCSEDNNYDSMVNQYPISVVMQLILAVAEAIENALYESYLIDFE